MVEYKPSLPLPKHIINRKNANDKGVVIPIPIIERKLTIKIPDLLKTEALGAANIASMTPDVLGHCEKLYAVKLNKMIGDSPLRLLLPQKRLLYEYKYSGNPSTFFQIISITDPITASAIVCTRPFFCADQPIDPNNLDLVKIYRFYPMGNFPEPTFKDTETGEVLNELKLH